MVGVQGPCPACGRHLIAPPIVTESVPTQPILEPVQAPEIVVMPASCGLWIFGAMFYAIYAGMTNSGLYASLIYLQVKFGELYYPVSTIVPTAIIVALPALCICSIRRARAKRNNASLKFKPWSVRQLLSVSLACCVLGATAWLLAQRIPPVDMSKCVDVSVTTLGDVEPPMGPVRLIGEYGIDHAAVTRSNHFSTKGSISRDTLCVPVFENGDDTKPCRFFIGIPGASTLEEAGLVATAGVGRPSQSVIDQMRKAVEGLDESARANVEASIALMNKNVRTDGPSIDAASSDAYAKRGILSKNGLPTLAIASFEQMGVKIANPHYFLFSGPDEARYPYYVVVGISAFFALLFPYAGWQARRRRVE
jgi:hypothetical protein